MYGKKTNIKENYQAKKTNAQAKAKNSREKSCASKSGSKKPNRKIDNIRSLYWIISIANYLSI
jgi:hypothetical protein